jgi:hypothetical protein
MSDTARAVACRAKMVDILQKRAAEGPAFFEPDFTERGQFVRKYPQGKKPRSNLPVELPGAGTAAGQMDISGLARMPPEQIAQLSAADREELLNALRGVGGYLKNTGSTIARNVSAKRNAPPEPLTLEQQIAERVKAQSTQAAEEFKRQQAINKSLGVERAPGISDAVGGALGAIGSAGRSVGRGASSAWDWYSNLMGRAGQSAHRWATEPSRQLEQSEDRLVGAVRKGLESGALDDATARRLLGEDPAPPGILSKMLGWAGENPWTTAAGGTLGLMALSRLLRSPKRKKKVEEDDLTEEEKLELDMLRSKAAEDKTEKKAFYGCVGDRYIVLKGDNRGKIGTCTKNERKSYDDEYVDDDGAKVTKRKEECKVTIKFTDGATMESDSPEGELRCYYGDKTDSDMDNLKDDQGPCEAKAAFDDIGAEEEPSENQSKLAAVLSRIINGDDGLEQIIERLKTAKSKKKDKKKGCKKAEGEE